MNNGSCEEWGGWCQSIPPGIAMTPKNLGEADAEKFASNEGLSQTERSMSEKMTQTKTVTDSQVEKAKGQVAAENTKFALIGEAIVTTIKKSIGTSPYLCGNHIGDSLSQMNLNIQRALATGNAVDKYDILFQSIDAKEHDFETAALFSGVDVIDSVAGVNTIDDEIAPDITDIFRGIMRLSIPDAEGAMKYIKGEQLAKYKAALAEAYVARQFIGAAFRMWQMDKMPNIPIGRVKKFLEGWYEKSTRQGFFFSPGAGISAGDDNSGNGVSVDAVNVGDAASSNTDLDADIVSAGASAGMTEIGASQQYKAGGPYIWRNREGMKDISNCCGAIKVDADGKVLPGQKFGTVNMNHANITINNKANNSAVWNTILEETVGKGRDFSPHLLAGIIASESSGGRDTKCINPDSHTSVGVLQVSKKLIEDMQKKGKLEKSINYNNIQNPKDMWNKKGSVLTNNIHTGLIYIMWLRDDNLASIGQSRNDLLGVLSYNMGPGSIMKKINGTEMIPQVSHCYSCRQLLTPGVVIMPAFRKGRPMPVIRIMPDGSSQKSAASVPNDGTGAENQKEIIIDIDEKLREQRDEDGNVKFEKPKTQEELRKLAEKYPDQYTVMRVDMPEVGSGGLPATEIDVTDNSDITQEMLNRVNELGTFVTDSELISKDEFYIYMIERFDSQAYQNAIAGANDSALAGEKLLLDSLKMALAHDIYEALLLRNVLTGLLGKHFSNNNYKQTAYAAQ